MGFMFSSLPDLGSIFSTPLPESLRAMVCRYMSQVRVRRLDTLIVIPRVMADAVSILLNMATSHQQPLVFSWTCPKCSAHEEVGPYYSPLDRTWHRWRGTALMAFMFLTLNFEAQIKAHQQVIERCSHGRAAASGQNVCVRIEFEAVAFLQVCSVSQGRFCALLRLADAKPHCRMFSGAVLFRQRTKMPSDKRVPETTATRESMT